MCESKPPPRKRKAPVETVQDQLPKKKARKSPTKELFDHDLDVLSFPGSTVLAPPVPPKDVPSFLDAAKAHPKQNAVKPSEGIVPPPNKGKRAKNVVTSCGDKNAPEDELTNESKATESGKKKRMSRNVQVVDSKDDTVGADASVAVLHRDEWALTPPSKLKPVVELTKRRSKKNVVQSDEEVDLGVDAFGESEDELLMESKSTRGRAKATSKIPAPKGDKRGKNKNSHAKPTSGNMLEAQAPAPAPELIADVPKQLGTSMGGARDAPQGEAASRLVPHDLAAANSNPPLPPLRDTNKSSDKLPSTNLPTIEHPTPKLKRASMGHTIPKRKDSMTSLLQRAGLHAPLSSSRLTVPATARIAPLHFNRKTPPPPPLPVPKPKKTVGSDGETDEEEYMGLSERQITKLKEEKRKRAWYSP